jgi:hypothetical protein
VVACAAAAAAAGEGQQGGGAGGDDDDEAEDPATQVGRVQKGGMAMTDTWGVPYLR